MITHPRELPEIIGRHSSELEKLAIDHRTENLAAQLKENPESILEHLCGFGPKGFVALAGIICAEGSDTYLSVQRVNRAYNEETLGRLSRQMKRMEGKAWFEAPGARSRYYDEIRSDPQYMVRFPYVNVRLWSGAPAIYDGNHCDWGSSDKGLVMAPEVADQDLFEHVLPRFALQLVAHSNKKEYYCKMRGEMKPAYNEMMRLYKVHLFVA